MTTENTKEAPASTRHLDTLYHETFNSSLGETGEYEGHSIIRTETGGDWYADLCDPSDEAVEGHKEIVRRVNGYPELLKQLSHKEREVERLRAVLSNAKGWIIANTSKPVHDLIRLIDSALEAKSIQPPAADASRVGGDFLSRFEAIASEMEEAERKWLMTQNAQRVGKERSSIYGEEDIPSHVLAGIRSSIFHACAFSVRNAIGLTKNALPKQAGDWRPIETAPKKRTLIDLFVSELGGRVTDCYWKESQIKGHTGWWWGNIKDSPEKMEYMLHFEPTHWMPLPQPPVEIGGAR